MPSTKRKKSIKSKRNVKSWIIKSKLNKKKRCFHNFFEKMGVFVIACDGKNKRYDKFLKKSKSAKIHSCKISCVRGKDFEDDFICNLRDKNMLKSKAKMTKVEVAINMSHYNAWKLIVESKNNYGLVFEDDVEVSKNFIPQVNKILSSLEKNNISFSILHLWNGNWGKTLRKTTKVLKINEKLEIIQENDEYNAGAVCYILSKDYAKFLLKKSFPISMPQDELMGTFYNVGNHLSLKMKFDKKQDCYVSPLLKITCGGEFGTGTNTTQIHGAPTVNKIKC